MNTSSLKHFHYTINLAYMCKLFLFALGLYHFNVKKIQWKNDVSHEVGDYGVFLCLSIKYVVFYLTLVGFTIVFMQFSFWIHIFLSYCYCFCQTHTLQFLFAGITCPNNFFFSISLKYCYFISIFSVILSFVTFF